MNEFDEKESWELIKKEYSVSKREFGKRIFFIKDEYKRKIIFRDIAQAHILSQTGFFKPAVVLAGSILEELLRLYLENKKVSTKNINNFNDYIESCKKHGLLKINIAELTHVLRGFRNLIHIKNEVSKKENITKSTAIASVSSIFTIANNFKK